jgi:hypothetical protein
MSDGKPVGVGLDVHKPSVRLAAMSGGELLAGMALVYDHEAVERELHAWPGARVCYEARPTGFGLRRHLVTAGIDCVVVAPGLVPSRPGDWAKTNKRDARRLAALHAGGLLTAIFVPSPDAGCWSSPPGTHDGTQPSATSSGVATAAKTRKFSSVRGHRRSDCRRAHVIPGLLAQAGVSRLRPRSVTASRRGPCAPFYPVFDSPRHSAEPSQRCASAHLRPSVM